jgi:adenylylsulfate kinase-like enzyme
LKIYSRFLNHDGWDVVFYVKGLARTGKSTIVRKAFEKLETLGTSGLTALG